MDVEWEHVYFAFPSGRLGYDCVICGAKCCRGFGYLVSNGHELLHQLERRPHIRYFLDRAEGSTHRAMNAAPACFFLATDATCEVHSSAGYEAKPETCRLFPFNNMRLAGSYLIVAPHVSLCPLEVRAAGTVSDQSSHETLFGEIARRGISSRIMRCDGIVGDLDRLVALERRIVALSAAGERERSFTEFIDVQTKLTREAGFESAVSHEGSGGPPTTSASAGEMLAMMCRVLGLRATELDTAGAPACDTVVVMTPFLRSQLLFVEARAADSGIAAPSVLEIGRVPNMILATYAVAQLAHLAGMRTITFLTVSKLFSEYPDLIWMLAHLDEALQWKDDRQLDLTVDREAPFHLQYLRFTRALLPARQRRAPQALGDLLLEHNTCEGLEQVKFLKFVASRVRRDAVSCARPGVTRFSASKMKAAIQRWSIENIGEEQLVAASARRNLSS